MNRMDAEEVLFISFLKKEKRKDKIKRIQKRPHFVFRRNKVFSFFIPFSLLFYLKGKDKENYL